MTNMTTSDLDRVTGGGPIFSTELAPFIKYASQHALDPKSIARMNRVNTWVIGGSLLGGAATMWHALQTRLSPTLRQAETSTPAAK